MTISNTLLCLAYKWHLMKGLTLAGLLSMMIANAQSQSLSVVGSSTVYPFTSLVAERFSQVFGGTTPKIESTGTGGGFKLFCAGIGSDYPDISNASRPIKDSEVKLCADNGISEPLEIKIGFDGIVLGQSLGTGTIRLSREQLFTALARELPDASGNLSFNQHQQWSSIDPSLPDQEIRVYGPPPTSGTRDAFVELAMEEGCKEAAHMDKVKAIDEERFNTVCSAIREDGAFIEAGENDNLIIQRLVSNPESVGIFGYSFLEANLDKIAGVPIDGAVPTFESIEAGSYPLSRPLFIYVKSENAQQLPTLSKFIDFYASEASMGPDGFLAERGLVPLPNSELIKVRTAIKAFF